MKRAFRYDKIITYFDSDIAPLMPSDFVLKYGDFFFENIQRMVSALLHDKLTVLSGYYASNANFIIDEAPAIFADRSQKTDILVNNMLLFELTCDLLLFDKFRDVSHFFAIFGKYIKSLIGDADAAFSNWLDGVIQVYSEPTPEEENELISKTIVATTFILLHEYTHLNRALCAQAIRMFVGTESFVEYLDGLSEDQIEEAVCDFNALYIMTTPQISLNEVIGNSLKCSATNILTYGLIMLHADILLDLLKSLSALSTELDDDSVDKFQEKVFCQMKARVKPLISAAEYTQRSDCLSLGNLDISKALNKATSLVDCFFECIIGAHHIVAETIRDITEKNTAPVALIRKKAVSKDKIWFKIK